MVKYLRRLGHEVTVITAAPPGHQPGASDGVERTASLNASPALRRLLLRPDRSSRAPAASALENRVAPAALWRGLVPDPWVLTWNPYASQAVRRELARHRPECVITSSPAESTHLLAARLGDRRPAWVADFRDGWGFEPLREPFPFRAQRALDRRLERRTMAAADVLVGATRPIAADFRSRFGRDGVHIPNGFDREAEIAPSPPAEFDAGKFTLVHTGPLLGPRGRDPRPLLAALRSVAEQQPELGERVELLVVGRSEYDERRLVEGAGVAGVVRHLGHLPRREALALQRAADSLVLLTSPATCEATGKLYEYLAADRPIIALAAGNEAARIVTETATGVVVAPDDQAAIAAALRTALSGDLRKRFSPRGLEAYRYPAPAEQMAGAIERAIAARTARQPAAASSR